MKHFTAALVTIGLLIGCLFGANATAAPKKLKLNHTSCTIKTGKTKTLKVISKKNSSKITWKSSNKKIATVSKKGLIKAKKPGKVTITAKLGKLKATCKVTVSSAEGKTPDPSPTPSPSQTPYPTPPNVPRENGAGWYTGKVISIESSANPDYIAFLHISEDGSDQVQAHVALTGSVSYTKNGNASALSEIQPGDWINFNSTIAAASFPSTIYGCSTIIILGQ